MQDSGSDPFSQYKQQANGKYHSVSHTLNYILSSYILYIKGMSIVISDLSTDLQETVSSLLEEKKQLTCQLQDQQRQIEELTALVSSKAAFELFTQIELSRA